MRYPVVPVLILCAFASVAFGADNRREADLDRLQGNWELISTLTDNVPTDFDHPGDTTLKIAGQGYKLSDEAAITTAPSGRLKLDATQRPRQIDAHSSSGPNEGKVSLGIYELSGDRLRIMLAPPGKPRPTSFSAEQEEGCTLQIWQRLNREPIPKPAV